MKPTIFIICFVTLADSFPRLHSDPWQLMRREYWTNPLASNNAAVLKSKSSNYKTEQFIPCGITWCRSTAKCSRSPHECAPMGYGPPCCIDGSFGRIRKRDSVISNGQNVGIGGAYGPPTSGKSQFEKCVEEIKAAGSSSFNFTKMYTILRIIKKLGQQKFLGEIKDKMKDLDFSQPVFGFGNFMKLREEIQELSPCSGYLYQDDVLLQNSQMDSVLESAICYVGESLRNVQLKDIFAESERQLILDNPGFTKYVRPPVQPPAPTPYRRTQSSHWRPGHRGSSPRRFWIRSKGPQSSSSQRQSGLTRLTMPDHLRRVFNFVPVKLRRVPRTVGDIVDAIYYYRREKRKITLDSSSRWTMPIRYRIDPSVDSSLVEAGLNRWKDETCLTFEKTSLGVRQLRGNFLNFKSGEGCHSMVGRNTDGEGQQISIGPGCDKIGTVSHEIGHALGLWHEQSRPDRDDSVSVLSDNIAEDFLGQFMVEMTASDKGLPYDYGSIMHYAAKAYVKSDNLFSISDKLNKIYKNTMGQRKQLSFLDVKIINTNYCGHVCGSKSCSNGGYADPRDCSKCKCPTGLGGDCSQPQSTTNACGQLTLTPTNNWKTLQTSGNTECNYLIKAPGGTVELEISKLQFSCAKICREYLEVKFLSDLSRTGARICCKRGLQTLKSQSSEMLLLYRGGSGHSVSLRYKLA